MTRAPSVLRLRSAAARLAEQGTHAYQLSKSGGTSPADSIVGLAMRPALDLIDRALRATEVALEQRTSDRVDDFAVRTADAGYMALATLAAALFLALVIVVWLSRSITSPLRELDAGMRAVAEGQFGHPLAIAPGREDEFGRLAASYRSMATQLREIDRLKAEFVSVASHELRTPVNVILGYVQLLQETVYGDVTPRQREILETLSSQTQLLARLIRQLLDVSRFEAGGGKGFFPLDRELELLPGKLTPQGQEQLVRLSGWMPFERAVEVFADFTGMKVAKIVGMNSTETAGAAYVQMQEEEVGEWEQGKGQASKAGADKMQISADGAMVPLRHGIWAEVRTLVVGEVQATRMKDGEREIHTRNLSYFSRKVSAQDGSSDWPGWNFNVAG